jgi:APA family basic amino acid/polyamine antiporter
MASTLAVTLILLSVTGFGERVLDFMLRLTTASSVWFYAGICLAGLVTGVRRGFAVIGLGFCAWLLYGTGLEAGGLGVLLMAVAVPLHFLIGTARTLAPRNDDVALKAMAS